MSILEITALGMKLDYSIFVANNNIQTLSLLENDYMILSYEDGEVKISEMDIDSIAKAIKQHVDILPVAVCYPHNINEPLRISDDILQIDVNLGYSTRTDDIIRMFYEATEKELLNRGKIIGELIEQIKDVK